MKQLKFLLIILLTSAALFNSCTKHDLAKVQKPSASATDLISAAKRQFIIEMANHREVVPDMSKPGSIQTRKNIQKTALWEQATIFKQPNNEDVVVVPIRYGKSISFSSNFSDGKTLPLSQQSKLVMAKDSSGNFKTSVVLTIPEKVAGKDSTRFSGYVIVENWDGVNITTKHFKNGKVYNVTSSPEILANRDLPETGKRQQSCEVITWYECDEITNGVGYNCRVLYTEVLGCTGDEGTPDGGGGGGGGPAGPSDPTEPPCDIPDLNAGSVVVKDKISQEFIQISALKKYKNPYWRILKNTTWGIFSKEEGIIEHVTSPIDRWEWRSFVHKSLSFAGQVYGGTITYQGDGTPSFVAGTPNVLYAGMQIDFTVTYAPICNCPGVNIILPPTTIPYSSTAIWDAKPL